jgi:hypothetical protein
MTFLCLYYDGNIFVINSIIFANNMASAVKIFTNNTVKDPKILPYIIQIIVPIRDKIKLRILPGNSLIIFC